MTSDLVAISRAGGGFGPPVTGSAPTVVGSALVADNEGSGVNARTLTMTGISSAGTLLSWVGIKTANFAGPPTANNSNAFTQVFSQDYGPTFTAYTLRGYRSYSAGGGSDHAVTVTKDAGDAEELTIASLLVSRGSIVSSSVVNRTANGAGATLTSGSVTVTSPALLVAIGSGTGDVNATPPTETWPGTWTVQRSVARGTGTAPLGHVPMYLATRSVGAGTYTVDVVVTINEGIVLALYAVQ